MRSDHIIVASIQLSKKPRHGCFWVPGFLLVSIRFSVFVIQTWQKYTTIFVCNSLLQKVMRSFDVTTLSFYFLTKNNHPQYWCNPAAVGRDDAAIIYCILRAKNTRNIATKICLSMVLRFYFSIRECRWDGGGRTHGAGGGMTESPPECCCWSILFTRINRDQWRWTRCGFACRKAHCTVNTFTYGWIHQPATRQNLWSFFSKKVFDHKFYRQTLFQCLNLDIPILLSFWNSRLATRKPTMFHL